jgi:hypothetical protein
MFSDVVMELSATSTFEELIDKMKAARGVSRTWSSPRRI